MNSIWIFGVQKFVKGGAREFNSLFILWLGRRIKELLCPDHLFLYAAIPVFCSYTRIWNLRQTAQVVVQFFPSLLFVLFFVSCRHLSLLSAKLWKCAAAWSLLSHNQSIDLDRLRSAHLVILMKFVHAMLRQNNTRISFSFDCCWLIPPITLANKFFPFGRLSWALAV